MSGHSKIGPSSAERWVNCPGSVALSASLPASPANEFSAEGVVAHTLAEALVTGEVDEIALVARIGDEVEQEGFKVLVTDEMVDACVAYDDVIEADFKTLDSMKTEHGAEQKVQATSVDEELWGTLDYHMYGPKKADGVWKLVIYDFKFGKGHSVSAEKNKQLGAYLIAVIDKLKTAHPGIADWEKELVIVQPRTYDPVRRWLVPNSWIDELREQLKAAVADTRDPLAKVAAGDWCRWCPAKATCPELYKKAQETAAIDFAAVVPPTAKEIKEGQATGLPHPSELSVDKLVLALGWEDAFDAWFKAIRQRATDLLSSGQDVPGYKLVEGRANRRYKDEAQIVAVFEGVVGERLWEKKLLSPAKLEAIVGKGKLIEYTEKPEGRKTLARESDSRQAVRSSAAADFGPPDEGVAKALELDVPKKCEQCEGADLFGPCPLHAETVVPTKKMWPD